MGKVITKLIILDVDGVLTDGKKLYDKTGRGCYKTFCDRDFTAIKAFKAMGIPVVFLSGDPNVNEFVAYNRGIPFYCNRGPNGYQCKSSFLPMLGALYGVTTDEMVYVGDDIWDIEIMKKVGRSFCPADSSYIVKNAASQVLNKDSGQNVIEDLLNWHTSVLGMELPPIEEMEKLDQQELL